jgi:hypothetical protein
LKLPDVHSERPLFDFLLAFKGNNPTWAETQEALLNQTIENKGTIPTIYKLIANFRNHLRLNRATAIISSQSAFATLYDEPQDQPVWQQQASKKAWTKLCICKQIHLFKKCPYFIEKLRGKG